LFGRTLINTKVAAHGDMPELRDVPPDVALHDRDAEIIRHLHKLELHTIEQLAKIFKVDRETITNCIEGKTYRHVPMVWRSNRQVVRDYKREMAMKLLRTGLTVDKVVQETGLGSGTVCEMRRKLDLPMTHNNKHRITGDQIDDMVELHCNQGLTAAETARRLGVAPSTVFKYTQLYQR
jgi:AraC-like DNA-binding protein